VEINYFSRNTDAEKKRKNEQPNDEKLTLGKKRAQSTIATSEKSTDSMFRLYRGVGISPESVRHENGRVFGMKSGLGLTDE